MSQVCLPARWVFLAGKDLLARIDEHVLAQVDERVRNDSGLWVGITGRQRVLRPHAYPNSESII